MSVCVGDICSEVFRMTDFFKKTKAELEACKKALDANSSSLSDQPVLDGDVITMAVKFERLIPNIKNHKMLLFLSTWNLHCKIFQKSQLAFLVGP